MGIILTILGFTLLALATHYFQTKLLDELEVGSDRKLLSLRVHRHVYLTLMVSKIDRELLSYTFYLHL